MSLIFIITSFKIVILYKDRINSIIYFPKRTFLRIFHIIFVEDVNFIIRIILINVIIIIIIMIVSVVVATMVVAATIKIVVIIIIVDVILIVDIQNYLKKTFLYFIC